MGREVGVEGSGERGGEWGERGAVGIGYPLSSPQYYSSALLKKTTGLGIGFNIYSKTCVKRPFSKRQKIGFRDQLSLYAGQNHCRLLQREHSGILSYLSIRPLFCLFVSGRFTHVFLYCFASQECQ